MFAPNKKISTSNFKDYVKLIEQCRAKAKLHGFAWFDKHIFPASFPEGEYVFGEYVEQCALDLAANNRFMAQRPRGHRKSTVVYSYLMYRAFITERTGYTALYFSYNEDRAKTHIKNINRLTDSNPFFALMRSTKGKRAENVFARGWDENSIFTIEPYSILSGVRGLHSNIIILDDVYSSAEDGLLLESAEVLKINDAVLSGVRPMFIPQDDSVFIFIGTPMDYTDLFHNESFKKFFLAKSKITGKPLGAIFRTPAINEKGEALWKERYPLDVLQQIREEITPKNHDREYLLVPAVATDTILNADKLYECIDMGLPHHNWEDQLEMSPMYPVFLGWDIGTSINPTHIAVFRFLGEYLVQLASIWWDRCDIDIQIDRIWQVVNNLRVVQGWADNKSNHLDFVHQRGLLPPQIIPLKNNRPQKGAMAGALVKLVNTGKIKFVDDDRQRRSLLMMPNSLQARQRSGEHADAFTSVGLVAKHARLPESNSILTSEFNAMNELHTRAFL